MNVKEMIEWLKTQDQEAIVQVISHSNQWDYVTSEDFTTDEYDIGIPKYYEYGLYDGKKFLLLGELNG